MTDLQTLLRGFESIGNNCEFGIVQRAGDYDPPGLFRNVGFQGTEQIINAIAAGLEGLFDDGRYAFVKPDGWPDYALDCRCYGFQFHTGVAQTETLERAQASIAAFRMMKRLFLESLQNAEKIFVYRHQDPTQTDLHLAERLLAALRRYGPNWLLFVCQDKRPEMRFAYAEQAADGLIMGGIPKLSEENPPQINFSAWEKLMRIASDLRATAVDGERSVATLHQAPASFDGPLFSVTLNDLAPGTQVSAEGEVYVPSDFTGGSVGLLFWGYESRQASPPDTGLRDTWQKTSVTAFVPPSGDRAVMALHNVGGSGVARVWSRDWRVRTEVGRRSFRVVRCAELPPDTIRQWTDHPPIDLPLAPVSFGQTTQPSFRVREFPDGGWNDTRISLNNIRSIELAGAIVHGEEGAVTVGDKIVFETVRLARFGDGALKWEGQEQISMPVREPVTQVGAGLHLFCGTPGVHNYAHFLVDMVCAAAPPFGPVDRTRLWPQPRYSWQAEYINLLSCVPQSVFLGQTGSVFCHNLRLSALSLIDSGHFPHPDRMPLIAELKRRCGFDPVRKRRIYISRRDSRNRALVNEAELIETLNRHGFETFVLNGMPVRDQIRLFAEAECVVAQHGAGAANIIFCPPQTVFCELFADNFVQWSMRRLASIIPLRYGCVVGRGSPSDFEQIPGYHDSPWTVDINEVLQALRTATVI